jgi:hypothetical protein
MSDEIRKMTLPVYRDDLHFSAEARLGSVRFACDLSVCKGACCTMPGALGAPILESEIAELERVLPYVAKYLSSDALDVIEAEGVWHREKNGSLTIPAVERADCIFVRYDGDVALCAIESAHRNGEITGFAKPISCHLFPIRIYPEKRSDGYYICYEEIEECEGGRVRGEREEIPLLEFLEKPLVRALGTERVALLKQLLVE